MGQMRGYFSRCRGVISAISLVAIALFTAHALSSLVFSVLGLAPSSPQWGLALTLGSFLAVAGAAAGLRSEEHTSELQSLTNLVCRLLLEKKNFFFSKFLTNYPLFNYPYIN